MSGPATLSTVYATDENVAIRAGGDFSTLCPDWQKLAYGIDGVIDGASPWTLTSASVDFGAAGVKAQHVVLLRKPTAVFKGGGELLAVDTASSGSITLRRLGQRAGVGQPPSPSAGVTGVEFLIQSFDAQIEEASFQLNRRYNIDPNVPGRTPTDLYDLRDLRYATVLTVLAQRYSAESREAKGDFAAKLKIVGQELTEVLARLTLRWTQSPVDQRSTNWFSTRIVR